MKRFLPALALLAIFLGVFLWRRGFFDFPTAPATVPPQNIFPGNEAETYLSRMGLAIEYDAADPLQAIKVMTADGAEVEGQPSLLTPTKALLDFPLDFKETYKARVVTRYRVHENTLSPTKDVRAVVLAEFEVVVPKGEIHRAMLFFSPDADQVLARTAADRAQLFSVLELKEVELDKSPLKDWAKQTLEAFLDSNREKRDARLRAKWERVVNQLDDKNGLAAIAGSESWFAVTIQKPESRISTLSVFRVHGQESQLAYTQNLAAPDVIALAVSENGSFIAVLTADTAAASEGEIKARLQLLR